MVNLKSDLIDRLFPLKTKKALKKILILGIGNYLMGDEGVGVHFARFMDNTSLPEYLDVVERARPARLSLPFLLLGRERSRAEAKRA